MQSAERVFVLPIKGGNKMKEQIKTIKENAIHEIEVTEDLKILNDLRVKYLGKKGELTVVLRGMGALSPEERPVIGSLVNQVRDELNIVFEEKEKELKREELQRKLETENIDVTEPSKKMSLGSLHPITQIIQEVEEIFLFNLIIALTVLTASL